MESTRLKAELNEATKKRNRATIVLAFIFALIFVLFTLHGLELEKIDIAVDFDFLQQFEEGFMPTNTKNLEL